MLYDADVIVVGSGAGGATFAHDCARAGKRVLVLERGRPLPASQNPDPAADEQGMLIEKKPYDDRRIDVNGTSRQLYMGGVPGGSTALYGAALMRPSPEDFVPGCSYSNRLPRALWEWPLSYDSLEPYYAEAERLYGVSAEHALHPINQRLVDVNQKAGLRPFRLPLAIDFRSCLQCAVCPGYLCPTGARHSSAQLLEASNASAVKTLTNVEVERLVLDGKNEPDGVEALDRATGRRSVYRARRYVLAAGAIGSPLVLQRSGLEHPHLGRNYMMHYSPLVAGIFTRRLGGDRAFLKQVGFTDYYFGDRHYAHKMGLVQSLPVPGPLMLAKAASRFLPRWVLNWLRARMLPLVGIIEDLPDPANRVFWGASGQPCLQHRFGAYDLERGRALARLMAAILKRAGAAFCLTSGFASEEHVAHQCGTARFGRDPAEAVLDFDCRMHGQPSVFVVDGSFMPTSLGVGPALTIMANALRVARIVAREI
jgi:choline dehydrogenase-like flavoprotein